MIFLLSELGHIPEVSETSSSTTNLIHGLWIDFRSTIFQCIIISKGFDVIAGMYSKHVWSASSWSWTLILTFLGLVFRNQSINVLLDEFTGHFLMGLLAIFLNLSILHNRKRIFTHSKETFRIFPSMWRKYTFKHCRHQSWTAGNDKSVPCAKRSKWDNSVRWFYLHIFVLCACFWRLISEAILKRDRMCPRQSKYIGLNVLENCLLWKP